jgi:hypothetical protein
MGIMPHRDVERALQLALSLDIPFWPQLPNVSLHEDMYIQTSQNFPGITIDVEKKKLAFSTRKFEEDLEGYFEKMDNPETYSLTPEYSMVFREFLSQELSGYRAIRGQVTGPVSFGFKVLDENMKPIIYNDSVKDILFDFIQKKVNVQYREMKGKNLNAFVWVDEPGLGYVFSGLTGYNDQQAKADFHRFIQGIEGLKGLHLCAEVNLPYLLELGIEILSFDAHQMGFMPKEYTETVAGFLKRGGIISWGIVPAQSKMLAVMTPEQMVLTLAQYWEVVSMNTGMPLEKIAEQALIAPARCCLREIEAEGCGKCNGFSSVEEAVVEKTFSILPVISQILRERYRLL